MVYAMEKSGALFLFVLLFSIITSVSPFLYAPSPQRSPIKGEGDEFSLYLKQGHHSQEWDSFVESGFQAFGEDNYATSLIFMNRAYQKGCRDPLLLYRLGVAEESAAKLSSAVEYYQDAHKNFPRFYPQHPLAEEIDLHLGRALFRLEKYQEAFPYLETALQKKPSDVMLLFMVGQLLREKKEYLKAQQRFLQIKTSHAPFQDAVQKELVLVSFELKQYDESLRLAEEILRKNPADQIALAYRQKVLKEKQKQKEKEIIEKIVK